MEYFLFGLFHSAWLCVVAVVVCFCNTANWTQGPHGELQKLFFLKQDLTSCPGWAQTCSPPTWVSSMLKLQVSAIMPRFTVWFWGLAILWHASVPFMLGQNNHPLEDLYYNLFTPSYVIWNVSTCQFSWMVLIGMYVHVLVYMSVFNFGGYRCKSRIGKHMVILCFAVWGTVKLRFTAGNILPSKQQWIRIPVSPPLCCCFFLKMKLAAFS